MWGTANGNRGDFVVLIKDFNENVPLIMVGLSEYIYIKAELYDK